MRLVTFRGRTLPEAMRRLREGAGDGAMLVGAREDESGAEVTAALDAVEDDLMALLAPARLADARAEAQAALLRHGVPQEVRHDLDRELAELHLGDATTLLACALGRRHRFEPIGVPSSGATALVGPAGAGKTAAVARLAVAARLAGHDVLVASTDVGRSGGVAQLRGLIAPLGMEPITVGSPAELRSLVEAQLGQRWLIVDTMGVNAFRGSEVTTAAAWLSGGGIEPVLALPAGLDAADTLEIAGPFAAMGARRLLVTRLDAARRLGAVLGLAGAGFALAEASVSPIIGRPMPALTPGGLARLLMRPLAGAGEAGA